MWKAFSPHVTYQLASSRTFSQFTKWEPLPSGSVCFLFLSLFFPFVCARVCARASPPVSPTRFLNIHDSGSKRQDATVARPPCQRGWEREEEGQHATSLGCVSPTNAERRLVRLSANLPSTRLQAAAAARRGSTLR